MRSTLACVVLVLALFLPHALAGQDLPLPKGAKRAALAADGVTVTAGGVKARLEQLAAKQGDETWAVQFRLTLRKGKKKKVVDTGWVGEPFPAMEVVALGKLVWLRDGEVIVAPAKKLTKRAISDEKAIAVVQAEADRRGLAYDGAGAYGANGVAYVELSLGATTVVRAVVGKRSKKFLRYDVAADGDTQAPVDPTREPEPIASSNGMQTILDEHNRYRAAHCAPALAWSDTLAAAAQTWAETLRDASCAFEHSNTKYGENLAAGSTGYLPPEEVVGMWYREIDAYDFAHGGFSMDTGHFTQVVWKGTKSVGCGMVTDCAGMDIWVCNYDPPGNYEGKYDKNVLPTTCK